jgi:serine/threonine protein phosphatase PrpC
MVICPKCSAENRPEAAFCAQCGTILFTQPAPVNPLQQPAPVKPIEQPVPSQLSSQPVPAGTTEKIMQESSQAPATQLAGFASRSEGAIFGNRFRYDSLLNMAEHDILYTVTEVSDPQIPPVRICSNPTCRTIHSPMSLEIEKFCTVCGQPLDERSPIFMLQESDIDKFGLIMPIIDLHLVHPNVHPPISIFKQDTPDGFRYCLVTPYSQDLPSQPDVSEALDWGEQLAQALDYLQTNGIVLCEEVDQSNIGMSEGKVVWRNFSSTRISPILTDREKINNVRLLALAMYSWMTGKSSYSIDPYLPAAVNDLFQKALVGDGFTSATEFEQQITLAKSNGSSRLNLDYQIGRRTHAGMVRSNNEDSVLSMELSILQQGIIQPIILCAIADGMGGHASGELASSLVTDVIAQIGAIDLASLRDPSYEKYADWVKRSMQAANQKVYKARQNVGNDMGSTLVLGLIVGSQAYLGHLGDSRIYLLSKGNIQQLTEDHSLVQHLVMMGKISQEEARFHPQRNVIYRSLGENSDAEADYLTQQLFPNDRLLFCSDGLTSMLDDQKIQKIILEASSPQTACDQLVNEANLAGGEDNISVVLVEVLSF